MPEIPKSPFQEPPNPDADIFADLDALAGEVVTTAQSNLRASEPVSSASADKPKARTRGTRKENGNDADTERMRARWIEETEQAIDGAKSLEQLMKLVDSVKSKSGRVTLSFPLPLGLPTLLKNDQDFSKEFNSLFDRWSERVTETLFGDSESVKRFQGFLHDSIEKKPDISMGRFFGEYLDRCDSAALKRAPLVIARMKELWTQLLPVIKQELKTGKNRSKEVALGGAYVLKNDPSKEYKVTEISDDGEITYVSVDGGLPAHSSKEKFLKYFQAKGGRSDVPLKDRKAIVHKKVPTKFAGRHKGGEPDEDAMRRYLERKAASGKNGASNLALSRVPAAAPDAPPIAATPSMPDIHGEPSPRTYEDLCRELGENKLDASLKEDHLRGSVAVGLRKIIAGLPIDISFENFIQEHKDTLVAALARGVAVGLADLSWPQNDKEIFSAEFVGRSIESSLNKIKSL